MRRLLCPTLAAVLVSIVSVSPAPGQDAPKAPAAADFKAYIEKIPATDLKFEMLPIPGGKFTIGSPTTEAKRGEDEGPQREIEIKPFWMAKCEVTWDEFDQFAFSLDLKKKVREGVELTKQPENEKNADAITRSTPPYADPTHGMGRNNQPALCITHHAAMEYTRWLSQKTGKAYRLATEAEWEYAARAGTKTIYSFGDDASKLGEYAWYLENCEKPQQVGKKKPNPWGLHDMHGNVAEWVLDHYAADRYSQFPSDKPSIGPVLLPDALEYSYVARGGSWDDDPELLRSATRRASNKEWSVRDPQRPQSIWWHTDATFVGIRVVRAFDEQDNLKGFKSAVISKKGTKN